MQNTRITKKPNFDDHIEYITSKALKKLGFLKFDASSYINPFTKHTYKNDCPIYFYFLDLPYGHQGINHIIRLEQI